VLTALDQLRVRVAHQIDDGVDDIDEACATLRAAGIRLIYDQPRRGTADSRINFVHPKDAGGVLVELVQAAPDAGH